MSSSFLKITGTSADFTRSPAQRERVARGKATLSAETVTAIRRRALAGEAYHALAAEFGISPAHLSNIARRKSYRWVEDGLPATAPRPCTRRFAGDD
jgi:hypothetical protein